MDVHDKLDELTVLVEEARSMPMSASCIVHRGDVLALLDDVRELLPEEFRHAELLLQDREAVVDEGKREADRMLEDARGESEDLLASARAEADELLTRARAEADRLIEEAQAESARLVDATTVVAEAQRQADEARAAAADDVSTMRRETDEYVERKLEDFEAVLSRTLAVVARGRDKLRDQRAADDDGGVPSVFPDEEQPPG
jgi:cell division septum initiation protein DivIVA